MAAPEMRMQLSSSSRNAWPVRTRTTFPRIKLTIFGRNTPQEQTFNRERMPVEKCH